MYYLEEQEGKVFITKESAKTVKELSYKFWDKILKAKEDSFDIAIRIVDSENNIINKYCYTAPNNR